MSTVNWCIKVCQDVGNEVTLKITLEDDTQTKGRFWPIYIGQYIYIQCSIPTTRH